MNYEIKHEEESTSTTVYYRNEVSLFFNLDIGEGFNFLVTLRF